MGVALRQLARAHDPRQKAKATQIVNKTIRGSTPSENKGPDWILLISCCSAPRISPSLQDSHDDLAFHILGDLGPLVKKRITVCPSKLWQDRPGNHFMSTACSKLPLLKKTRIDLK